MPGTVVEVTEVLVEAPLDGTRAMVRRLAICSTFEQAAICASQRMAERAGDHPGLLYYVLDMILLDTGPLHQTAPTAIYSGDDKLRGMIPSDIEKPWGGRAPEDCTFKPGDLVGFVNGDVYRVGIILGLPPSPEEARRWGSVTLGDDVYLVGLLDAEGSPETNDHEHLAEPELFEVGEVPRELREKLTERRKAYLG